MEWLLGALGLVFVPLTGALRVLRRSTRQLLHPLPAQIGLEPDVTYSGPHGITAVVKTADLPSKLDGESIEALVTRETTAFLPESTWVLTIWNQSSGEDATPLRLREIELHVAAPPPMDTGTEGATLVSASTIQAGVRGGSGFSQIGVGTSRVSELQERGLHRPYRGAEGPCLRGHRGSSARVVRGTL